jgi:prepilin-type N-terminal cleavage/methylation domain-containing protein
VPSKPTTKETGFTIIEVMMVLAIAGMIMLIIFLAIPALQRSSRNNQRKQDVSAVLGAVTQYMLNNSGTFPGDEASVVLAKAKINYYDNNGSDIKIIAIPSRGTAGSNNTSIDQLSIYNRSKCDPDNPGQATSNGAGYSDIVALYHIETGGDSAPKCLEQ